MASTKHISAAETRKAQRDSGDVMLVCAYEDEEKCEKFALNGSFSLKEFQTRFGDLPKSQKIVFYCN